VTKAGTAVFICAAMAAVGCQRPPTFSADVAPLINAHCATCHRPGQGAPFSLLVYEDARSRASAIAEVTAARRMPPWLPDASAPPFEGERRLKDDEIDILQRWADNGAPAGDLLAITGTPPPPASTWQLGQPDVVVQPGRPFSLTPGHEDVFRNLVIRTNLPADRHVRAVEFHPGDAPIHHAVIHLDATAGSRTRDGSDGRPGFDGMGAPGVQEPDGHFVGWAPGRGPILSAAGRPWRLSSGTDLVVELHLMPGASATSVRPSIGLYFAEAGGAEAPVMLGLGDPPIDIPAGATNYTIADRYTLPVDVQLLSVYPHAHYLGKTMLVEARLPAGEARTLLHIPRWSFHWQQDYRYRVPVSLPRGTTIEMRFTYDNSEANPDNPHHPPVRVTSGLRSVDEMGNLLLQLVPVRAGERSELLRDVTARQASHELAAAGRHAAANPRNIEALTVFGSRLLAAGRAADAVAQFQSAAQQSPGDARLQFNLARALSAAGSPAAAEATLRRAIGLDSGLAEAHDELGVLLFAQGRLAEALRSLERAVELAPDSAIYRSDFGGGLAQAGRRTEALAQLKRALELDPNNAAAKQNLARLQGR
jgi:Flp pilus assembly protein TadD